MRELQDLRREHGNKCSEGKTENSAQRSLLIRTSQPRCCLHVQHSEWRLVLRLRLQGSNAWEITGVDCHEDTLRGAGYKAAEGVQGKAWPAREARDHCRRDTQLHTLPDCMTSGSIGRMS